MKRQHTIIALAVILTAGAAWAVSYKTSNYEARGGAQWVVGGALDIASGGALDVESGGGIDVESGADLDIESGGGLDVQSGADIDIESGGDLDIQSGGDLEVESGGDIDVQAGGDIDVTGDINIKIAGDLDVENGGDLTIDSGGALTASSGSTVNLAGTVQLAGTALTPTAGEINTLDNVYSSASTAVTDGSESANAHTVSLTVKNADSTTLTSIGCAIAHYSSTSSVVTYAAPDAITATTGAISALGTGVYSICWNASGAFVANVYEDGGGAGEDVTTWLMVQLPGGKLLLSADLNFD